MTKRKARTEAFNAARRMQGMDPEPPKPPQSAPFSMTKEQINGLQLGGFRGRVSVASTAEGAQRAANSLSGCRMLGFDTESKPSFRKGETHRTALLQLSSDRHAALFRLHGTGMPSALRWLLETPKITKIGQGFDHELKTLKKEHGVVGRGFLDLLHIANRLNCTPKSVRGMAAIFLGVRISKSAQMTNWERHALTEKQERYAATDAWICLKIYEEMRRRGLAQAPVMKG